MEILFYILQGPENYQIIWLSVAKWNSISLIPSSSHQTMTKLPNEGSLLCWEMEVEEDSVVERSSGKRVERGMYIWC